MSETHNNIPHDDTPQSAYRRACNGKSTDGHCGCYYSNGNQCCFCKCAHIERKTPLIVRGVFGERAIAIRKQRDPADIRTVDFKLGSLKFT